MPVRRFLTGLLVAAVLLCLPLMAQNSRPATAPPVVALCDLFSNPQAFDRQWIQVRGTVSSAFEDFSLRDPSCDRPLTRNIWLMYGGDQETPVIYCCGDHSRPKGKDVSVRGQQISLVRDAAMENFFTKVNARRARKVNGEPCDASQCNLYDVSANIVGLFFAVPNDFKNPMNGFGHLGCCHLLVIHKVSDVDAERTAVPDDYGSFTCSKQSWQVEFPPLEGMLDRQSLNRNFLAQQMRQHDDAELIEIMQKTISKYAGITGTLVWTSPDLLTTYSIPNPNEHSAKKAASASRITTVTRERCVAMAETPAH